MIKFKVKALKKCLTSFCIFSVKEFKNQAIEIDKALEENAALFK